MCGSSITSISNRISDILKYSAPGSDRNSSAAPLLAGENLFALVLFSGLDLFFLLLLLFRFSWFFEVKEPQNHFH